MSSAISLLLGQINVTNLLSLSHSAALASGGGRGRSWGAARRFPRRRPLSTHATRRAPRCPTPAPPPRRRRPRPRAAPVAPPPPGSPVASATCPVLRAGGGGAATHELARGGPGGGFPRYRRRIAALSMMAIVAANGSVDEARRSPAAWAVGRAGVRPPRR